MTKLERTGKLALVDRIGLTRRRVDQLIDLGVLIAGCDEGFDLVLNERRYRAFRDIDREYVAAELNAATDSLQDGLRRLRATPDIEKRRKIAKRDKIGAQIGRIDAAFRLGNSMTSEESRPLIAMATDRAVGDAISEFFDLLHFTYVGDDDRNTKTRARAPT